MHASVGIFKNNILCAVDRDRTVAALVFYPHHEGYADHIHYIEKYYPSQTATKTYLPL